jgi:hypothetical protein
MAAIDGQFSSTSLSKLPLGLLALFGIKTQGRYPSYLTADVQLGLDQLGLMVANHKEDFTATGTPDITTTGIKQTLLVPQQEVWYVAGFTGFLSSGAGEAINAQLIAGRGAGPDVVFLAGDLRVVGASVLALMGSLNDFWLGPGDFLGFNVEAVTGAIPASIHARILRLPI